jgi:hypothetical protein
MQEPETPFHRHWLYYIVLKFVLLAIALGIAFYVYRFFFPTV